MLAGSTSQKSTGSYPKLNANIPRQDDKKSKLYAVRLRPFNSALRDLEKMATLARMVAPLRCPIMLRPHINVDSMRVHHDNAAIPTSIQQCLMLQEHYRKFYETVDNMEASSDHIKPCHRATPHGPALRLKPGLSRHRRYTRSSPHPSSSARFNSTCWCIPCVCVAYAQLRRPFDPFVPCVWRLVPMQGASIFACFNKRKSRREAPRTLSGMLSFSLAGGGMVPDSRFEHQPYLESPVAQNNRPL